MVSDEKGSTQAPCTCLGAQPPFTFVSLRHVLGLTDTGPLRTFLDAAAPLAGDSHHAVTAYLEQSGTLVAMLEEETWTVLRWQEQFSGFTGDARVPNSVSLRSRGIDLQIIFNRDPATGRKEQARLSDVLVSVSDEAYASDLVRKVLATPVTRQVRPADLLHTLNVP